VCARVSRRDPSPRLSAWIVAAMLAMIAVPAAITLHTVSSPGTLQVSSSNPTPYGYTWSLLLFIVPIVVIGFWFLPAEGVEIPRRAFWRTIAVLVPLGFGLDFFFAHRFFVFPNSGATLGIGAPALGAPVPVEEYIFYFTGFLCVLLMYVWLDEFWLAAYNVPDYAGASQKISRLFQFHVKSAIVGVVLIVAAVIYKKMFSAVPDGFPSYFTFLVVGAVVPSMRFFPTARSFINWRAFSLTLFLIVLISLLWEATLAVPYEWWGFQPAQMTGLFIGAWAGLPIEEVCLWIAVSYATVIVFEIFKLWQASGKKAKHAFLGKH
jgi:hypothetical protein